MSSAVYAKVGAQVYGHTGTVHTLRSRGPATGRTACGIEFKLHTWTLADDRHAAAITCRECFESD